MQSIYDADFDYPSHFDVSWKALFAKLLFLENIMFVLEGQAHSVFGKQMKAAILACTFQHLTTLGIRLSDLNPALEAWIKTHINLKLQTIEVFVADRIGGRELDVLKGLVDTSMERDRDHPLVVFAVPRFFNLRDRIYALPAIYPRLSWSAAPIATLRRLRIDHIRKFHLYLDTLSDREVLQHALDTVNAHFPKIRCLEIQVPKDDDLTPNVDIVNSCLRSLPDRINSIVIVVAHPFLRESHLLRALNHGQFKSFKIETWSQYLEVNSFPLLSDDGEDDA